VTDTLREVLTIGVLDAGVTVTVAVPEGAVTATMAVPDAGA
jgi:hypothetical protein